MSHTNRFAALAVLLAVALLHSCGPSVVPTTDRPTLQLGMTYDAAVAATGSRCEHVHDRGVRVFEWHYPDGSAIEATIHDGGLSGLNIIARGTGEGASNAQVAQSYGIEADMPEEALRNRLGVEPVTTHDESDRECRWTYDDGTLTAIFMRGKLRDARWQAAEGVEPVVLVEVTDEIAVLLEDLRSEESWDRARALQALDGVDDPRLADALIELLRVETDRTLRSRAARLMGDLGDERASDLLLRDLESDVIFDDILYAFGKVGNVRAVEALDRAYARVGSQRTKNRIRSAQRTIERRFGVDLSPDW